MSSWVLFKFKSQKDPTRISFDGTGITVFELKREIINTSQLGDGTDFDLSIYDSGTNDEYDDDTAIVSRSSMVIARRLPATRPGYGKAARYVSGRMPVNSRRVDIKSAAKVDQSAQVLAAMNNAQTEEEKIAAMFAAEGDQWKEQQQQMAHAKPVFFKGKPQQQRPAFADKPLPTGYICHRCQQKGHWIYDCPTNDDPTFVPKPKLKKTTGIPRSFLEKIDKSEILEEDEEGKPKGYMIDAEGNRVRVKADTATWEKEQARQKATAARQEAAEEQNKELQEHGLECSLDHRMFEAPTKTPCCSKTYCHGCIEDALVNNDLICPNCGKEDVLIDDLLPDTDTALKVKAYREEKAAENKARQAALQRNEDEAAQAEETAKTEEAAKKVADGAINSIESIETAPTPQIAPKSPSSDVGNKAKTGGLEPAANSRSRSNSTSSATKANAIRGASTESSTKKRAAEDELENDRKPSAPPVARTQEEEQQLAQQQQFLADMEKLSQGGFPPIGNQNGVAPHPMAMNPMAMGMMNPMAMMNMPGFGMPQMMNGMGMSNMPNMPNMPNMAMMNGMNTNMNMSGMNNNFNNNFSNNFQPNINGQGFQQQPQFRNQNNWHSNGQNRPNNFQQQNQQQQQRPQNQNFRQNQFNKQHPHEEDNAYFRQPVNPNRHQKQRRMRPSEYTEL